MMMMMMMMLMMCGWSLTDVQCIAVATARVMADHNTHAVSSAARHIVLTVY